MRPSPDAVQSVCAPAFVAHRRRGAALTEYALLVALIAVGLVAIVIQFRNSPGRIYDESSTTMDGSSFAAYGASSTSSGSSDGGGNGNGNANGNGNGNGGNNGNNGNNGNGNGNNGNGNGNGNR